MLPNQVFNDWTVIESAGKDSNNKEHFKCKCCCGTVKVVRKCSLGNVQGCGCSRKQNIKRSKLNVAEKKARHLYNERPIELSQFRAPRERSLKVIIDRFILNLKEKHDLREVWEE